MGKNGALSCSRREFLSLLAGGSAICALGPAMGFAEGLGAAAGGKKPNFLFIAVDDLRTEMGCYGHPLLKTPNLDRLAASGVLFTRAYCQQAVCAPSRASLLSGCRPDTTKIYDLNTPLRTAMPDVLSLPQYFKNNGYRTISLGKIYHHGTDDPQGWTERPKVVGNKWSLPTNKERHLRLLAEAEAKGLTGSARTNYCQATATEAADVPDNGYADGVCTDMAVDMLRKHKDEPFFLAVGFIKPHLPFNAPQKYWDLYDRAALPLPPDKRPAASPEIAHSSWGELRAYTDIPKKGTLDEAKTRELIHGYYACVSYVDAQVGRLLDELDRLGLADNTVVVLWGDHGWKLGEYSDWCKHTNFELDTHAPLLIRAPGIPGGRQTAALTEFVDIYPTLAELAGLPVPAHCEGDSVAPLLKEPERQWKSAAFSQYPRRHQNRPVMGYSMRTGRWRYTEWQNMANGRILARELYDHAESAIATRNVADSPENAELVRELEAKLRAGWRAARPK